MSDNIETLGDLHVNHILADGNKATGALAGNFGSDVGTEGNIDCTGNIRLVSEVAQISLA